MKGLSLFSSRSVLGTYLRQKRQDAGFTQVELARMLDYSSQFIANWERGASSPPANALRKLIRVLKIPENEILELLCQESVSYWRETVLGKRAASREASSSKNR